MATVTKKSKKPSVIDPYDETSLDTAHVILTDRDRDIVIAAFNSKRPNLALKAAAEKYKKQCA